MKKSHIAIYDLTTTFFQENSRSFSFSFLKVYYYSWLITAALGSCSLFVRATPQKRHRIAVFVKRRNTAPTGGIYLRIFLLVFSSFLNNRFNLNLWNCELISKKHFQIFTSWPFKSILLLFTVHRRKIKTS